MTSLPPVPVIPGWYPDPDANDVLRWWDGYRWTDDFAPRMTDPADSRNGYATASLVLGIVSIGFDLLFLPSILALVFGVAALGKAKRMGQGRGMAIAGMILGGVGAVLMVALIVTVLALRYGGVL